MLDKRRSVYIIIIFIAVIASIMIYRLIIIAKDRVSVINKESFFDEYEIIDDEVHIYCMISLRNNSSKTKKVKILGDFQKEVDIGLLKENNLEAYFVEEASSVIVIDGNSTLKYVKVEFVGEYAGNAIMSNRLLPQIKVIEID